MQNEKAALKETITTSSPTPTRCTPSTTTAATGDDNGRYNRQLDMQNNNYNGCRLFINPNVFSDYAIGRYIDDTSQTRTVSSATSTAALGQQQDSWTWRSASPFSHSTDLVRSVSNGGGYAGDCDNWCAERSSVGGTGGGGGGGFGSGSGKFKLLRSKFIRNRRNKLNRYSNKIAETTGNSAYIRAENGFPRQCQVTEDKLKMQPQTAAAVIAASILMPPKVKPKVVKGPAGGGALGGSAGGGGGKGVGDINDPMMRRPRRRVSEQKKKNEDDFYARFFGAAAAETGGPEKYVAMWYLWAVVQMITIAYGSCFVGAECSVLYKVFHGDIDFISASVCLVNLEAVSCI